jgi:hypothetical protein
MAILINNSRPNSRQKLKIGRGREEIAPPAPGFHGAGNPGRLLNRDWGSGLDYDLVQLK